MRSILRLEAIGDNLRAISDGIGRNSTGAARAIGKLRGRMWAFAISGNRPWVAEIVGFDSRFGLARQFLRPKRDYSEASSTGARGIYLLYELEEGCVYEVHELTSWKNHCRYFVLSEDGENRAMSREEVVAWLHRSGCSESTCSPPRENESPGPSTPSREFA